MDHYRSVYDQPLLRGMLGSIFLVFALWAFFMARGNHPALFFHLLRPVTLSDWLWLAGILSAAHLAGFVSGFLRTSMLWLVLGILPMPFYWTLMTTTCGQMDAEVCRSTYAPGVFFILLTIALALPVVALSGIEFLLKRKGKKPNEKTVMKSPPRPRRF